MQNFLFFDSILGGLLIGLAAMLLLLFNGRVAGISGLFWGFFENSDELWRFAFIAGLPMGATFAYLFFGAKMPSDEINLPLAAIAGLIVGVGTKLGSGCTSGHGVCGIGRRSLRSLIATLVFMSTGILTVSLMSVGG